MEVLLANAKVGTIVPLYREENKYYIDESNLDNLVFLDNGTQFVITSEKSGYMHLYLTISTDGKDKRLPKEISISSISTVMILFANSSTILPTKNLHLKNTFIALTKRD